MVEVSSIHHEWPRVLTADLLSLGISPSRCKDDYFDQQLPDEHLATWAPSSGERNVLQLQFLFNLCLG